jgi:hypothetical protein
LIFSTIPPAALRVLPDHVRNIGAAIRPDAIRKSRSRPFLHQLKPSEDTSSGLEIADVLQSSASLCVRIRLVSDIESPPPPKIATVT